MMSAPSVKPALPPAGAQPPKVGSGAPPPSTSAGGSPSKPLGLGLPNTAGTPPAINHAPAAALPLPLSLVQEHKASNVGTIQQQLPIPRPVEKKEFQFSPSPAAIKPTSNGVEGSPTKLSPIAQHIPPELKKVEEESPALLIPNHSVEPVKPAAPPPQPAQAVAPPAPVASLALVPPAALVPVAPASLAPVPPAVPAAPAVPKQDAVNTVVTAVNASSAVKTDILPKPEVAITKTQVDSPLPLPPPVIQQTPPIMVNHPAPIPQPIVETPVVKPIVPAEVVKTRTEAAPKPEFKVATPPRNSKRKKEVKPVAETKTSSDDDERKSKRVRTQTQPYQSPIPEILYMAKLKTPMKSPDDKLIVFYKNEFLAVRNSEGGFYICQAMQNIYKSSLRIRIRWLSQEKKDNKTTDVYTPDFYDATDFDCILTNLDLKKLDKNKYQLPAVERERTQNILKRALDVEKGVSEKSPVTEEHPDGLDLSLYRNESQLKRRKKVSKRGGKKRPAKKETESEDSEDEEETEDESADDVVANEVKKPIKLNIKRVEKPKTPAKPPPKEPEKRADQTTEREKRGTTSKRRSESVPVVAEKKTKIPAKPVKKVESTLPTRSAKTRSVRAAAPTQSLPPTRTKEREVRKAAAPSKGRKKPAAKKA